jgi:hypothetical protein
MVAVADSAGLQAERVEAGVRLGDREAGLVAAFDQRRQHAALLLLGAEHHHRVQAEDVHMQRRCPGKPGARCAHRLHHQRGLCDAEAGAAERFGNADAEPAIGDESPVEVLREAAFAIPFEPIIVAEARAELLHRRA